MLKPSTESVEEKYADYFLCQALLPIEMYNKKNKKDFNYNNDYGDFKAVHGKNESNEFATDIEPDEVKFLIQNLYT